MARQKKRADGRFQKSFTFNGSRYYVYGRSMQELDEKKDQLKAKLKAGKEAHDNPTFEQYYRTWTDNRRGSIREATLHSQAKQYNIFSAVKIESTGKEIGKMKLSEITVDDIREVQKKLVNKKRPAGEDGQERALYTTQTINDILAHVKHVFKTAVEERKIDYNPCTLVKPLKRTEERARDTFHRALTKEETKAFFEAAEGSYYYDVFRMAINTGMRIGEIGALYTSDIRDGMITVERTITRLENGLYEVGESAKTEAGRRTIPMNDTIREIIEHQKGINRMLEGDKVMQLHDRIFKAPGRGLLNSTPPNREIKRICNSIGIEPFTMHSFRATFATRAIEQGINPRTIQEILGHSDFSITMNLYGHVLNETKKEAMKQLVIAV